MSLVTSWMLHKNSSTCHLEDFGVLHQANAGLFLMLTNAYYGLDVTKGQRHSILGVDIIHQVERGRGRHNTQLKSGFP